MIYRQPRADVKYMKISDAAKHLNVGRTTIYRWVEKGILNAWQPIPDAKMKIEFKLGEPNALAELLRNRQVMSNPFQNLPPMK